MCNTSSAQLSSQSHRTRPTDYPILYWFDIYAAVRRVHFWFTQSAPVVFVQLNHHITQASMHKNKSLSRAPIVHKYKYTSCDRRKNNTVAIRLGAGHSRRVYSVTERVLSFKIDIPSSVTAAVAVVANSREKLTDERKNKHCMHIYFVRKWCFESGDKLQKHASRPD